MKKYLSLFLSGILLLTLACGCVYASAATLGQRRSSPVLGGYESPATPIVTPSARSALNKALNGMVGADYTPVALVDTQVVSGTNYRLLCKISPVVPNAQATYNLVTVYQDLQGNARITDILESNVVVGEDGWKETNTPIVTSGAKRALSKATENLMDVRYEPVALVETKSSGLETYAYCLLCRVSGGAPASRDSFAMLYVYKDDLLGIASISNTFSFTES